MRRDRTILTGALMLLVIAGASIGLFIWPNYSEAANLRRESAALLDQIAALDHRSTALEALAHRLAELQQRQATECKTIPTSGDLASLIRTLSVEVDRVNVMDQTFTAGSPTEIAIGGSGRVAASPATQAMPLTVDMDATFDSVFAMLQQVESLHRLVRVATVRIGVTASRSHPSTPQVTENDFRISPILKASIGLEAVFEPAIASASSITAAKEAR